MNGTLVARSELSVASIDSMFELFDSHFENVSRGQFELDLARKNWVLLLHDVSGALAGFSTILFYESEKCGEPVSVVYSGDTIVDPAHWNSPAMSRSWIHAVLGLHARAATSSLHWLLLTSGFRTYRFLPVFWRTFYPRHDALTPEPDAAWMNRLAREQFGAAFDENSGIVRFPGPHRLREHLRQTPRGKLDNPHVAFFLARNPGHAEGDELVCMTELSADNLTRAGWRMVDPAAARSGAAI